MIKKCLLALSLLLNFYISYSQVPNCATTSSPINGITAITTSGATLRWNAPIGGGTVTGYRLYLGTDAAATNVYNGVSIGNVLTTTLGTLLCSQTYFWQVVPFNITGSATGCSISNFSTSLSTSTIGSSAYYPLDGNSNDVSGNNRTTTLINSPTSVQDRNGNLGSAYYFNGINQEIRPTYTAISTTSSFSIMVWFNTTATIGGKLVGFGNLSTGLSNVVNDRHLYTSNNGTLYFGVYPSGVITTINVPGVNDGKWHQAIATLGTTNGMSLYLDGRLVARNAGVTTAATNYPSGVGFWRIGNDNLASWTNSPSNTYFNGVLDEITIYNREVSTLEVGASYGAFYNGQGCLGGSLILSVASLSGATYNWAGPNSFTSTLRSPTVAGGVSASSVGLYTATVTQGLCSYNFNTTVISNPIISNNTISGSQSVCNNGPSPSILTGSLPTGGDGALYNYLWQVSSTSSTAGFSTASTLLGINNGQNYTPPIVTVTSWFRRIVYSGGCSDISSPVQITATAISNNTNTASGPVSVCINQIPTTTLLGSTPTGATGIYQYNWQISTTSATTFFFDAPGTINGINYTFSQPVTQNFWIRRTVTSGGCNLNATAVSFTVNALIANNSILTSQKSVCLGEIPNTPFTGSTPTAGGGTYSYTWFFSSISSTLGFSPISNSKSYTPTMSLTTTSWFRRVVTSAGLCIDTSASLQVSVYSTSQGDPSIYGSGVWNVYGYNARNNGSYPNYNSFFSNYSGFYTVPGTTFETRTQWAPGQTYGVNQDLSPSYAPGYQGCFIDVDNHSYAVKGTNIVTTSGLYKIDLLGNDGPITFRLDDVLYYSFNGANTASIDGIYIGPISTSSDLDFTISENTGDSFLGFQILSITSAPGPLQAGSISGSDFICYGNTALGFNTVTTPSGGCTLSTYVWQSSTDSLIWTNLSNSNTASYTHPLSIYQKTWFRRLATDVCSQTSATVPVVIDMLTPPGNSTVYGLNMWNAYAFADNVWGTYSGQWTEPGLNFNSTITYGNTLPPSNSANLTYQGCNIIGNYYSTIYKRQGFPSGTYIISLTADNYVDLRINGEIVYQRRTPCLCGTTVAPWTGPLSSTDKVDFYHYDNTGAGYLRAAFTPVTISSLLSGGIIGYDRLVCSGNTPVPLANVTASWNVMSRLNNTTAWMSTNPANNACYVNTATGYQWKTSNDKIVWTDIVSATGLNYSPVLAVTTTVYFLRTARDVCGNTATSNFVTLSIGGAVVPTPTPSVGGTYGYGNGFWNIYAYGVEGLVPRGYVPFYTTNPSSIANYAGFYQDSSLYSFDTRRQWDIYAGPSAAVSFPANYNGCRVNSQSYAMWAKRTNIPAGTYSIDFGANTEGDLAINNVRVYGADCCGLNSNVWTGTISGSSLIDIRSSNDWGRGWMLFNITTVIPALTISGGSIGSDQTICSGSIPTAITNLTLPNSQCYIYYQWQSSTNTATWANLSGATTSSFTPTLALSTTTFFRRFVLDACSKTTTSNIITINVYPSLSVGTASSNVSTSCSPAAIQLQLNTVTGGSGALTYQWQSSVVSTSAGFVNYTPGSCVGPFGGNIQVCNGGPNVTTTSFFRVIVSSGNCSTVASNAFTFTVLTSVGIATQPVNISACVGSNAFLTTSATGLSPTYTWQQCISPCTTPSWSSLISNATFSGVNANQLTISGINASTGSNTFRVLYGSSCGPTLTSNSVNISLNSPPTINTQPVSSTICGSGAVSFNVGASGTALIYQWQGSTAVGGIYSNVSNGTPSGVTYTGGTTSALTVSSTGVVNYFYRALVNSASCSGISTTSGVALIVNPVIVGNTFTSTSAIVCNGGTASLNGSIPTGGSGSYSYQWQTSPDNSTWTNAAGGTSPTAQNYNPTAAISSDRYFQRIVTSGACTSTSTSNLISIFTDPVFIVQPVDPTTCSGNTFSYIAIATSTGSLNYQWQIRLPNATAYTNITPSAVFPNVTTTSLSIVNLPMSLSGSAFRAFASNGCAGGNNSTNSNGRIYYIPNVDVQPTSQITCDITNNPAIPGVTINYTVSGTNTAVQWQTNLGTGWVDMSNATIHQWNGVIRNFADRNLTPLIFEGSPTLAVNGAQYRFVISGFCNPVISNIITITVVPAIANNSISVNQNICSGFSANTLLGSTLSGGDGNYTYQWLISPDDNVYVPITGATLKNYYPGVMTATSWYRRQANSFNCADSYNPTSSDLLINVSQATDFVVNPTSQFVCNGTNALFTSSAVGLGVTYICQLRTSTASAWSTIVPSPTYPGYLTGFAAANRNLTVANPTLSFNGYQYRFIAQGGCNPPFDTSAVATLNINPLPSITSQPVNQSACVSSTANFSVVATAAGVLSYRWQVNPGSGWSNTATVSPYFNSTTSTLGILASFSVSGFQYRSILTLGSCVVTSTGATLTVNSLVGITSQPVAANVCEGSNTSFSVTATGTGLNYSWLTSANGGSSWTALSNNSVYSGVTSATLSITSTPSNLNSNLFRVIVGGSCNPSVTSTGVSLTVNTNPTVVTQPINRLVCSGGNTFFSVSTAGTNITYQWQLSTNSGSSWSTLSNGAPYSQATTATLSITGATVSMLGYQYRALITSTCFPTVTSSSATLTAAFASTWIGGISTNWFTVGNWCSTIPTATSDVLIQNTSLFMPVITGTGAICRDIVINSGASLTINSSNSLGVYGSWQNDGTYNVNSSSINFLGTALQSISGSSASMFNNITVGNSVSGVQLFSNQSITGTLTMGNNSYFTTTGFNFTLVSSALNTARIAAIPSSAIFTGNITMQRYIPAKPTLRLMSSAVNGSTLTDWKNSIPITGIGGSGNGFDPASANINTVWYYDETINAPTTYEYVGAPNINMPLNQGRGYRVFIRGDRSSVNLFGAYTVTPVVMSVTNPPNIGTIALPVTYTDYNAQFRDGTNLVGNPYPSEINWDAAGWTKTNIDNALYMWDPNLGTNGQYFSYVAGVAAPARSNPGIIASSQAFFIKASAPGTVPSLIITESVKTVAGHTANFRGASEGVANLLRLKLMDSTTLFDETAIRFKSGSSTTFEKDYDAYKMYNSTLNIYSNPIKGLDLSINTMPISDYTILPLSVYSNKKRQHRITFENMESFEDSVTLYLKDKYLNTYTQVNNGDSYNFMITTDTKSQGTDRFELTMYRNQIVTNQSQTGIGASVPMMKVYPNPVLGNSITLDLYNLEEEKVKVILMDMNGNVWYSQYHSTDRSKYFSTELNQFSTMPSGVYMISVMSAQFNSTQKVILIK